MFVQLCCCKAFPPPRGSFLLSCPIHEVHEKADDKSSWEEWAMPTHDMSFSFLLLPAFLLGCNHSEVTFPKQRALGHLSTADDQWEVRASVL